MYANEININQRPNNVDVTIGHNVTFNNEQNQEWKVSYKRHWYDKQFKAEINKDILHAIITNTYRHMAGKSSWRPFDFNCGTSKQWIVTSMAYEIDKTRLLKKICDKIFFGHIIF